jgi:CheY-like chemotaxis protein
VTASVSSTRTILVVDDEPFVRMVGAEMMANLGFEVLEAGGGEEALAVIASRPDIDLLLTDVRMPGMDGVELAKRAQALRPDLKVIFISGYTASHTSLPGPLVQKPFASTDLHHAVMSLGTC